MNGKQDEHRHLRAYGHEDGLSFPFEKRQRALVLIRHALPMRDGKLY